MLFLAVAGYLAFPEPAAAKEPVVTECPDIHPDIGKYQLEYAEISPLGSGGYGPTQSLRVRNQTLHTVDIFYEPGQSEQYRNAVLECAYEDGRGRQNREILRLPIPGILWRCESIIREWGKKKSRHLWAWCISLPE